MTFAARGVHSARRKPRLRVGVLVVAIFFALVLCAFGAVAFLKSKGVTHPGDSPAYVMQAQSYRHLSLNSNWAIHADLNAYYFDFPLREYHESAGPHGIVSPFEPGLGILLIPFVATRHLATGATVGMIFFSLAGLTVLHRRLTALTRLRRRGQWLLGIVLLSPPVLLATTQIFPDFVSGVALAVALVEIAVVERDRRITVSNTAIVTAAAAILPWLQIKNLVPAMVLALAWTIVSVRFRGNRAAAPALYALWAISLLSWLTLFRYNVYYIGHILGLPEPPVRLNRRGLEYMLGLLFDRHQGLFVQMPFAVFGVLGLWVASRKLPVAVVATVVTLGAILLLNGTYTSNPYGGDSLAGRFMWTLLPILAGWSAITIRSWETSSRKMVLPLLAVCAAWLYEAWPIIIGKHVYYNAYNVYAHVQEPRSIYPGWWRDLNSILPQFNLPGRYLGSPSWAIESELAILSLILACHFIYVRKYQRRPLPFPRLAPAPERGAPAAFPGDEPEGLRGREASGRQ